MPAPLPPPERALVQAFNAQRVARGLPALRVDRGLSRAAERHSVDLLRSDRLSHTSSDGTSFARRIARTGSFRLSGEIIAFTQGGRRAQARSIVRMFLRSPAHRAQLLDPRYRLVGVGRVRGRLGSRGGVMVTADLARG